jgi:histidinol-phosphate aminotransferase
MESIDNYIVPWVKDATPYSDAHIAYAWKHPNVDRLMANENFHPPSEEVVQAVVETARKGNYYPKGSITLREKLAKREGLKTENIFIANGSLEVIDVIARVFISPGSEAVIPLPTYPVYEVRVKLSGGVVHAVHPQKDLSYDIEGVIERINEQTHLVFIVNPNNPIGYTVPVEELRRVLDTGIPTVVDEAYYELEDEPQSMTFLLREYPNLIIMRTMSKAWGMAGFRIGYAIASEKIIDFLNRMRINFSIGLVNMAAAIAAIDNIDYYHKQNNETKKLRKELEEQLRKIQGLRVFPSSCNFILMDIGELGIEAEEIVDYLLKKNIQVRLMNRPELGPGFFRITIGTRVQHQRFVQAIKDYIKQRPGKN